MAGMEAFLALSGVVGFSLRWGEEGGWACRCRSASASRKKVADVLPYGLSSRFLGVEGVWRGK